MNNIKEVILAGGGGCMRELAWQIEESGIKVIGYCAPSKEDINLTYLGNDDYLKNLDNEANVVLCFGSEKLRKRVFEYISENPKLQFPALVLKGAFVSSDAIISKGAIIASNAVVSTGVSVGDFAFVNMASHISHDCKVGSFATISPRVALAGNVNVGDEAFLGINSTVIQGISIGKGAIVGAGAVVVSNVATGTTVVGVPAKPVQ